MGDRSMPANHRMAERKLVRLVETGRWRVDVNTGIVERRSSSGWVRLAKQMPSGYVMVRAMMDGRRVCGLAHRLVWQVANGDIPSGLIINHINGTKHDNRLVNLEVVTYSENVIHAHRTGLIDQHGQRNPAAKLSDHEIAAIRLAYGCGGVTQSELAARHGVSHQHVSKLIRGERRPKQAGAVSTTDHRHSGPRDVATGRFVGKKAAGRLLDGRTWDEVPR